MHPILATSRRLTLYLLAWTPILGLLVYLSAAATQVQGWPTLAFAPACFVFAFVCLSPWYICRARPLRVSNALPALGTFLGAGAAASLLLTATVLVVATAVVGRPAPPEGGMFVVLFALGILLYLLSAGVHYAALAVEASHAAEKRMVEARALAREAQLDSLRMQLNPHFLFNSLHSISALATQDGARAREMCLQLADFLRSSLRLGEGEIIPLGDELALARQYLEVERVRFGQRLQVEAIIDAGCENCGVPALLLQPLVENAVKHGIAGLVEGGVIRLAASRVGGEVVITLENAMDADAPADRGAGLGLENARRRIAVRYGQQGRLAAGARGGVYRVELRIPCESPIASSRRA